MANMFQSILLLLLLSQVVGCAESHMAKVSEKGELEIAPGKWLQIQGFVTVPPADLISARNPHQLSTLDAIKQFVDYAVASAPGDEKCRLEFEWNAKSVKWEGKKEIPITLREHNSTLYMVVFNRAEAAQGKSHLVFLKLGKKGKSFKTIKVADFPRQIATQNMWLGPRFVRTGENLIDQWQMLRKLDIHAPGFGRRFTAMMWYQIETGTEYDQIGTVDQEFLENYMAKYKPIALPTIFKEPPVPATNTVSNVTTNK